MAKYMGLSVNKIKEVWSRPPIAMFLILLAASFLPHVDGDLYAGQLQPGETFTDGQTVHASDLNNAIGNSTIQPIFIYGQAINNTPLASDYIVEYSPTLGGLYKTLLSGIFNNPQGWTTLSSGIPIYTNTDFFSFYSQTGTNVQSVTFKTFVLDVSTNLSFGNVNLTNGTPIGAWPSPISGFNTNFPLNILVYGTNGVPAYVTLTNLESALAGDLGSNFFQPYIYQQIYTPWTVYGTNAANYTNLAGLLIPYAITNFNTTNGVAQLTDTDAVPILSGTERTNTTATLGSIYQYLTNKNALPPYTTARIQFNGNVTTFTVSNNAVGATGLINANTTNFNSSTVYAVSFMTNSTQTQRQWAVNTNALYYVVVTSTNNFWMNLYTNYANAAFAAANYPTNYVTINNAGAGGLTLMFYCTNFTSFNADVMPDVNIGNPPTVRAGFYDVYFRTPAANASYYITGNAEPNAGQPLYPLFPEISSDNVINTNFFRISTFYAQGSGGLASPLVHVLVQPQ